MQLAPLIQRIATQIPTLRVVSAAASLEQAIGDLKNQFPVAYLLAPGERANPNDTIGLISNRVEVSIPVLLGVRQVADMRGDQAFADMDTLRPSLKAALMNWEPATGYDPIEYAGGRLMYYQDGLLLWADEFKTAYYARY